MGSTREVAGACGTATPAARFMRVPRPASAVEIVICMMNVRLKTLELFVGWKESLDAEGGLVASWGEALAVFSHLCLSHFWIIFWM